MFAQVQKLIAQGVFVKAACARVGMPRPTYYLRLNKGLQTKKPDVEAPGESTTPESGSASKKTVPQSA